MAITAAALASHSVTSDIKNRFAAALIATALLAPSPAFAQAAASPYTSATRYDTMGRVTGTISADPDGPSGPLPFLAVRNSYDAAGRLVKVETGTLAAWQSESVAPAAWTGFTVNRTAEALYDAMGRKLRDTMREGAAGAVRTMTQTSYDSFGRPDCTAVRMNPADFAAPPASACTQGTGAADRITRNIYDAAGQRLQVRAGVGSSVEGTQATWAYDPNGQITTVIDGNGNRAELHYDGHGRQDRWTFPSATRAASFNDATQATALASAGAVNAADYEAYGYDLNGNRTSFRKRDGRSIVFAYDALNRVTAKTYPQGGATAVHYGYDLRNLQLFARYGSAAGEGLTSSYDGFGRLASSILLMDGVSRTLTHQYDPNGNRVRLGHPDGPAFVTVYDGLNRPYWMGTEGVNGIASVVYLPHGAPLALNRLGASLAFDYDGLQRQVVRGFLFPAPASNVTWVHSYNPAGGIAGETRYGDDYAWTGAYNAARPYATNGLNQYATTGPPNAAGSVAFTYDANGNLTSETPWGGATTSYTYDIENRLIARTGGVTLRYDPLGRLYEVAGGSGTTRFLYDGDALVAEYNAAGTMLRRHAHWPGADIPMTTYEGSGFGTVRQLFPDRQGSIAAIADHNGTRLAVNSYDEYGIPGAGNTGRFQYTGQIWLAELGMYHYKARIYSPTLGRFLQTDPVGYQDQFNLYAYVGNDPMNRSDPTGTCWRDRSGHLVGVCPFQGADEGTFVEELLRDPEMQAFDLEAADAGRLVYVKFSQMTFGSRNPDGSWNRAPEVVDGENVEVEETGQRRIFVHIDRADRSRVDGRDRRSGRSMSNDNSPQENAAHGILGHAADEVRRRNTGEISSRDAENRWRRRHGPNRYFDREGDQGEVQGGHQAESCTGTRLCPQ